MGKNGHLEVRYLFLCLCLVLLTGLTPIYNTHDSQEKIDEEFRNLYLNVQPKQFVVVDSTPEATEFQNAEFVIFNSGMVKLVLTLGTTTYQLIFSSMSGR